MRFTSEEMVLGSLFIAAVNCAGQTGDKVFGGHSMIVDPWGEIVVEAGEQPTLLTGEINIEAFQVDPYLDLNEFLSGERETEAMNDNHLRGIHPGFSVPPVSAPGEILRRR